MSENLYFSNAIESYNINLKVNKNYCIYDEFLTLLSVVRYILFLICMAMKKQLIGLNLGNVRGKCGFYSAYSNVHKFELVLKSFYQAFTQVLKSYEWSGLNFSERLKVTQNQNELLKTMFSATI